MFIGVAITLHATFVACAAAENNRDNDILLTMPVDCEIGRSCFIQNYVDVDSSKNAKDYQCGSLTYDSHNGTDFRLKSLAAQKAGVNVVAAADGRVARTRDGVMDISVRSTGKEAVRDRECGNGVVVAHSEEWETQYCHMARGSVTVKPGQPVKAGQKLGQVGLSGLTEYPHLHFTVRYRGKIADPFSHRASADTCGDGVSLWEPALNEKLVYRPRAVLNVGFTTRAVSMELIEAGEGETTPRGDAAPAIVAFVRAIGLKAGDVQSIVVTDPAGRIIGKNQAPPLEKDMAQTMVFAGRKKPSDGWARGVYAATYIVEQNGKAVLEQHLRMELR
jgi:murein DD-endopeptidase MepM/ murein hydrolase activator NlpD